MTWFAAFKLRSPRSLLRNRSCRLRLPTVALVAWLAMACVSLAQGQSSHKKTSNPGGIHEIRHVIVIVQENRSFDSYFGTFPGADGFPMQNGRITVCNTDKATGKCVTPYHDPNDKNIGGPHGEDASIKDIDHGKMDGFINTDLFAGKGCLDMDDPQCSPHGKIDGMGYHNGEDIPTSSSHRKVKATAPALDSTRHPLQQFDQLLPHTRIEPALHFDPPLPGQANRQSTRPCHGFR